MKKVMCILLVASFVMTTFSFKAFADGCYMCGSGSGDSCKNYCKYEGDDNFENRKKCEAKGCKVSGTSSCPSASNYKVCELPAASDAPTVAWLGPIQQ